MNTIAISQKMILGLLTVSLVAALIAVAPFSLLTAQAAKKTVNLTCMQTAVDTRESAIAGSFSDFNDDIDTALSARKTALHDAWGISDKVERSADIKTAWATWKKESKTAHTELKSERKAAWATFKTTAKTTCKEIVPKEEALSKDASGSIAL